MRFSIILPFIMALATAPAAADVFKWKNANGETVFGQHPPAGVQAERIKRTPGKRSPDPAPSATPQERLKALQEKQAGEREQAREAAAANKQAAARKQNCASARSNLALYERGGHRRVRLPDGTVTFLGDAEIKQRIDQAKQQIQNNCD